MHDHGTIKFNAILLLILCISLLLNLYGIQWGLPALWYPDEPETIEDIVLPMMHRLDPNPHIFNKPTLYYYFLGTVLSPYLMYHRFAQVQDNSHDSFLGSIALISRVTTAFIGVLGVFLMYLLGKTCSGRATGLLAALLLACNLGYAAYSHFAYMDIPMLVLVLAACLFAFYYFDTLRPKWLYFASAFAGLSISTKYNAALPAAVLLGLCHSAKFLPAIRSQKRSKAIIRNFFSKEFLFSLLFFLVAFFAGSPFIILDFQTFYFYFEKQMGVSQGYKVFAESHAWIKNIQLLQAGMGTGVLLLLAVGFIFGLIRLAKKADLKAISLYLISITYLLYIGTWKIAAFRYVLPVIPFLILKACIGLQSFKGKWGGFVLLGSAALLSLFYSLNGIQWFSKDTRVTAEEWIARHLSPQSRVETYAYKMYLPKFPKNVQVSRVSSDYVSELRINKKEKNQTQEDENRAILQNQFTVKALQMRNPDFLILSSFYEDRFLSDSQKKASLYPELTQFFEKMLSGNAGYRIVAKFEKNTMQIFYINPTITILARDG